MRGIELVEEPAFADLNQPLVVLDWFEEAVCALVLRML